MKRAADHEKYVGIIHSIAQAEELEKKDKQKEENKTTKESTCLNCSKRKSCRKFNGKMTYNGTYSIGGDSRQTACDKWSETKNISTDTKKIKSLLKQFKKKF
jgi:hypothetical protein